MRRLLDWCYDYRDKTNSWLSKRAQASVIGLVVVWVGLLLIGLLVWLSGKYEWLRTL